MTMTATCSSLCIRISRRGLPIGLIASSRVHGVGYVCQLLLASASSLDQLVNIPSIDGQHLSGELSGLIDLHLQGSCTNESSESCSDDSIKRPCDSARRHRVCSSDRCLFRPSDIIAMSDFASMLDVSEVFILTSVLLHTVPNQLVPCSSNAPRPLDS